MNTEVVSPEDDKSLGTFTIKDERWSKVPYLAADGVTKIRETLITTTVLVREIVK